MNGFNWTALISAVVTIGSAVSVAVGQPVLGAIISNPNTATALTAVVTGIGGLVSAFAPALLHSTTVSAANKIATK